MLRYCSGKCRENSFAACRRILVCFTTSVGKESRTFHKSIWKAPARGPISDKNWNGPIVIRNLAAPTQRRASTVSPKLSIPFSPGGQLFLQGNYPHAISTFLRGDGAAGTVYRVYAHTKSVFIMRESWGPWKRGLVGGL